MYNVHVDMFKNLTKPIRRERRERERFQVTGVRKLCRILIKVSGYKC